MPTDASGTPSTNFSFPKYNTANDAPSGLGLNAIIDDIDAKLNDVTKLMGNVSRLIIAKAGTTVGTRRKINFIEGANVTLTIADDSGNEKVDVTVAAASAPVIAKGTFSITLNSVATNSSTITHGFGSTPTAVFLTFSSSPEVVTAVANCDAEVYATSVGATNFTLNIRTTNANATSGSNTLTGFWVAL